MSCRVLTCVILCLYLLGLNSFSVHNPIFEIKQKISRSNNRPNSLLHSSNKNDIQTKGKSWFLSAIAALGILSSTSIPGLPSAALAADTVKVGKCLLQSCQKELAQCILNPKCFANVICLNTCNGRKDEPECQIKCGDLFENDVVGVFNACAVSQKKCVPQKQDEGLFPIPAKESLVKKFDTSIWNGRWYITAGLNKVFDIFDCQVHFFTSPYPGKFYAKLFWRVTEPDGEFFTKNAIQRFVQDPKNPAIMYNHDNEYLHYKDDWYIVDYEPDDFVLVYYRGSNDAWDGYGGAFLYTRAPTLRPELIPRLTAAVEKMKVPYTWNDFSLTDNSCKSLDESPVILREKFASKLFITEENQLQEQLTAARLAAVNTIVQEEKEALGSIQFLEKELELFQNEAKKDVGVVVKDVEEVVEKVEEAVEKVFVNPKTGRK